MFGISPAMAFKMFLVQYGTEPQRELLRDQLSDAAKDIAADDREKLVAVLKVALQVFDRA